MANNGVAKILGDSLRKYPDSLFKNKVEGLDKLMTKQYGYISVREYQNVSYNPFQIVLQGYLYAGGNACNAFSGFCLQKSR